MLHAITQFRKNLASVKDIESIYSLVEQNFPLLKSQSEELLRATIALAVSALDHYIHDCVRIGMLEIYIGDRDGCDMYNRFPISMKTVLELINAPSAAQIDILESVIVKKNGFDSFHSPKGIEYALRIISIDRIWSKLSVKLNTPADDIKEKLGLIVERRNKIVHEADFNIVTSQKYPIDAGMIRGVVDFVEQLCESLHIILTET